MATTLALSSAVVYTRHLLSPHEGFLTQHCNISEKGNQHLDSDGPDQTPSIRHQPHYLKDFKPEPSLSLRPDPPACNQRGKQTKSKRKIQGVPQSQTTALPRHQEEEETDKFKQAQIEQTYEKHFPKRGNRNAERTEKHKNTRTKWHKVRHKTNRLKNKPQSNKE